MSLPAAFLSRPVTFADQPFLASSVTSSTFSPLARRATLMLAGRLPSWSLASSHTFLTEASVFSTSCVLVRVVVPPLVSVASV